MTEAPSLSRDLAQTSRFFELRLKARFPEGCLTDEVTVLCSEIWVGRQHLDEPHRIDLPLLVQSLHESRWFDIFTSGCAVSGCAGIAEGIQGIQVTHEAGLATWSFSPATKRRQSHGPRDE